MTQQRYFKQHFIVLGIIKGDFISQVMKRKISEDINWAKDLLCIDKQRNARSQRERVEVRISSFEIIPIISVVPGCWSHWNIEAASR